MHAIHVTDEDLFGAELALWMYWFFVRKDVNEFNCKTVDGTLTVEGFIDDNRRVIRLVDTTA